jgi:hypothetical protein
MPPERTEPPPVLPAAASRATAVPDAWWLTRDALFAELGAHGGGLPPRRRAVVAARPNTLVPRAPERLGPVGRKFLNLLVLILVASDRGPHRDIASLIIATMVHERA